MSASTTKTSKPNASSIPAKRRGAGKSAARLLEQLPPHAIEAEMCLLGSIIIEPRVLGDVTLIIKNGEEFFKPANGAIYDAMVKLYDENASLDVVQLHQWLIDREILDAVGGQEYLLDLANSVPTAHNADHYARLVREKGMIRRLIEEAGAILEDAYTSRESSAVLLDEAEHRIFAIAEHYEHRDIESLKTIVNDLVKEMEARDGRPINGVLTHFSIIDELTGGFQPGDFLIIAGRPSMGKSAIALNMIENMASHGDPVGLFSLEMSKRHLVERMLAGRAGIDLHRLRRMNLRSSDYAKFTKACGELQDAPVFIDDMGSATLLQIRARARRMVAKHSIKAVFIDYIQLVTSGGRSESRQMEVSEISRGLKALARELEIPVIGLSQLNRSPEQRETHRPRISDLRESGSLEQDADVVCLLHREEYYHQGEEDWAASNPDKVGMAEFIIAKQRNGPTGLVKLKWNRELTRFEDDSPYSGRAGSEIEANPGQPAYTADQYADDDAEAADVPF
ncbi:MAG: replicative DNA helicase [Planctomycetes bacterium]|nr:replicative DNA helicase [Planctomycetota bacterium]